MWNPGERLGPYEIVRTLGAGGMGEVHLAADRRLDRLVAIKVLPGDHLTETMRVRFQREGKAVAAMKHPHICALFDVGETIVNGESRQYLVMEYCEGETLAQRVRRGRLPPALVAEYGAQIASALATAHAAGIIHRDIKPQNVIVTPGGVKLLDFGLARQRSDRATDDFDSAPASGRVSGTPSYIAPELFAGGEPDERTDLFALGWVLYEMIEGPRHADTAASMFDEKGPEFRAHPPPALAHLVASCLRPDPSRRRQSAADLALDLRWAAVNSAPEGERGRTTNRAARIAGVILATVVVAAIAIALAMKRAPSPLPVTRRMTTIPIPIEASVIVGGGVAISPDGRSLVFTPSDGGPLYTRRLDEDGASPLPGTTGGGMPFFSRDGQWIGFWSLGSWKKVPISGGDIQTICLGPKGSATWGPDGSIVFGGDRGLLLVDASGGVPKLLTRTSPGEFHLSPSFLPDGHTVLFERVHLSADTNDSVISAFDLRTKQVTALIKGGFQPRYSPTGHLLFLRTGTADVRSGTLFSVDFDPATLQVRGQPKPRVSRLQSYPLGAFAFWDVGNDGTIIYVPHNRAFNDRELVWQDRSGAMTATGSPVSIFESWSVSPDGTRVAASDYRHVWIGGARHTDWMQLETEGVYNNSPIWSPDGTRVVFASNPGGSYGLYVSRADGSGTPSLLIRHPVGGAYPTSWSPDGRTILYEGDAPGYGWRTWQLDIATGRSSPLIQAAQTASSPVFSPDGRWVAWESQEPQTRIYAAPYPGLTPRSAVGTGGPCTVQVTACRAWPRWSADGREIYYKAGETIMAVEVDTSHGFRSGPPHVLFKSDFEVDPSSDGRRFLAVRWMKPPRWDHLEMVTGWWDKR